MRMSIFSVQDHYPTQARTVPELYKQILAQAELADQLGYDTFWVAEHHFHEYGAVPNPAIMLASIAQRTKRLRLGTAISILTFHNPLTVAESYAMVDILSDGRLMYGVGSGYLTHEFEGYAVDPAEKRDRFDETLAAVKQLLSGQRTSYTGKFRNFSNVKLNIEPVQKPIPIFVAVLRKEVAYSHHGIGELSDVIRPLDSLEHLFWLSDQNRPLHFAVTAQVSGETSVRDWREALARLKERHSLLSASIEGEPGAVPWFRQVNAARIPLRVVHRSPVAMGSRGCRGVGHAFRPEARATRPGCLDSRHGQRRLHARGSPRNRRRHVARLCSPRHASRALRCRSRTTAVDTLAGGDALGGRCGERANYRRRAAAGGTAW
jgi:hypothetical protein